MDAERFILESKRMCAYYGGEFDCYNESISEQCPFNDCDIALCDSRIPDTNVIDIVEKWSNEHPIITNADKLKEMFPDIPFNIRGCTGIDCKEGICLNRDKCEWNNFWCKEYKGGNIQ